MSRFDRQSFLGPNSEAALASLTVGLVGLGGGGSHVAQQLAHVGVGRFVLVDHDEMAETNLNRLVGAHHADIAAATPKVDIAQRLICAINPAATIQKHSVLWQEAIEALKTCDVIIGGLDSVRAKYELDAFARRFFIPYIDMGMDVHALRDGTFLVAGQVVLTGPGQPCLQCLGIVTERALTQEAERYGAAGSRPQVVWSNGVLASAAVGLFVQLVSPWHSARRMAAFLRYDGNSGAVTEDAALTRFEGPCSHYSEADIGDPMFDVRKFKWPPDGAIKHAAEAPVPPAETDSSLVRWVRRILRWPWRTRGDQSHNLP